MDIAAPGSIAGRTPWRMIALAGLLIIAIAAAALTAAGLRPPRPAPSFGPAANGSIVYGRDGDIVVADAGLTAERVLIGGAPEDIGVRWSLDGSKLYFGRVIDGRTVVMVADPDGGNVREVTTALPHENGGVEVAPDGTRMVALSYETAPASLVVVPMDPDAPNVVLPLGDVLPVSTGFWRPPDGQEIIFLGHPGRRLRELALYRIRADGTALTQIAVQRGESLPQEDARQLSFQDLVIADDGRLAAYWNWETGVETGRDCFVHLIDLETGIDRRMTYDPTAGCEIQPAFLADGRLIFERQQDGVVRLGIAPTEGGPVELVPNLVFDFRAGEWRLAPDRQTILWDPHDEWGGHTKLLDLKTGELRETAVTLPELGSWQRLAP